MIYLSIDPGLSHVGIALSLDGQFADPLTTLSNQDIIRKLQNLISSHHPDVIIVGSPPYGPITMFAHQLAADLAQVTSAKIEIVDEDLSSSKSQARLAHVGATKFKRKALDHSAAAAQILEDYLALQ